MKIYVTLAMAVVLCSGIGSRSLALDDPLASAQSALGQLNLTPEQRTRVDEVINQYSSQDEVVRPGLYRQELQNILTPSQMDQFDQAYERWHAGQSPQMINSPANEQIRGWLMETESPIDLKRNYSK